MNVKSVRAVRKVERPRPLKLSVENSGKSLSTNSDVLKKPITDVLTDLQSLSIGLNNCNYDENTASEIARICDILKTRGPELDMADKFLMDQYFVTFRNASREDRLDMISRLKLLEVIELKAMKWQTNENITAYYNRKITELEGTEKVPLLMSPSVAQNYSSLLSNVPSQVPPTTIGIPLAPGEMLRSSGKFARPTKIAGKNYFKDEVVIRNSDSGKVSPGVRDRLVQITGPNEEAISHAKTLVEDTIRRNASPMREKADSLESAECVKVASAMDFEEAQEFSSKKQLAHSFSMGDASLGEYSCKVSIGSDTITLSGANVALLKMAKIALQEYFADQTEIDQKEHILPPLSLSENKNFGSHNDDANSKNRLERSSSWMSSVGSRASLSPFDTSSEDETFKDSPQNAIEAELKETSLKNATSTIKDQSSLISRTSSLNSDNAQLGMLEKTLITEKVDNSAFFPKLHSLSLASGLLEAESEPTILPPEPRRKITYTREDLLKFAKSPLCKSKGPKLSVEATEAYPFIIRDSAVREPEMNCTDPTATFAS